MLRVKYRRKPETFSCPCQHKRDSGCQLNVFFHLQLYNHGHSPDFSTLSKTYCFQRLTEFVETFPADGIAKT